MHQLIGSIYEAAILPDRWPHVLEMLSRLVGARGGVLFHQHFAGGRWTASATIEPIVREFLENGWAAQNDRVPLLVSREHPGFLTDSHFFSPNDMAQTPFYRDFLIPRGINASAATLVRGVTDDALIISIEGFDDHDHSRAGLAQLDLLRPHLARSVMLAGELALERARSSVDTLSAIGAPAAAIAANRRVLIANDRFVDAIDGGLVEFGSALKFRDLRADVLLSEALAQAEAGLGGRSFPVRVTGGATRVAHVLPVANAAQDLFARTAAVLVITEPTRSRSPNADLIQRLLDLTPAEARLAHLLSSASDVRSAASLLNISPHTARNQLRSIFSKTGLTRQAELTALLATVGVWAPQDVKG